MTKEEEKSGQPDTQLRKTDRLRCDDERSFKKGTICPGFCERKAKEDRTLPCFYTRRK